MSTMSVLNNKVKSFTLSELLVVMVITSIVVGISFSVLNIVRKQIKKGNDYFEDKSDVVLFEHQFTKDINTTHLVTYQPQSHSFILKHSDSEINYTLGDTYAVRNSDTLAVHLQIKEVYFEGLQVNSGVCDAVLLEAVDIPNFQIFVSKENDATYYMNQDGL